MTLNRLRACEASIDPAMHRISLDKLGIPESSRDAFDILQTNGVIPAATSTAMKNMVGFRDIAVHSYEKLQRPILEAIVTNHLSDFETFLSDLSSQSPNQS